MKRIIYLLLILNLGLLSCVDDASVRVMPEFNCKDTKVNGSVRKPCGYVKFTLSVCII